MEAKKITKGAFDAVKGVVHYDPDFNGAVCGANGRKFSDFAKGVTCKRCLAYIRVSQKGRA